MLQEIKKLRESLLEDSKAELKTEVDRLNALIKDHDKQGNTEQVAIHKKKVKNLLDKLYPVNEEENNLTYGSASELGEPPTPAIAIIDTKGNAKDLRCPACKCDLINKKCPKCDYAINEVWANTNSLKDIVEGMKYQLEQSMTSLNILKLSNKDKQIDEKLLVTIINKLKDTVHFLDSVLPKV